MSYHLKNRELEIEVGNPTEYYNGSRFDLSGNIFQVVLNGKHTFCTTEKLNHHPEYGFGIVNEFDIDEPCSFSTAESGKFFHKIGVGSLLNEDDKSYNFFKNYPKVNLEYSVAQIGQNQLLFETVSPEIRGMKYEYRKCITIVENKLRVDYCLKNIGCESINTTEYAHNFISINKHSIDSSYRLKIGEEIKPENFIEKVNIDGSVVFTKNEMTIEKQMTSDFFISNLCGGSTCCYWALENIDEKVGVSENVDFECLKMNIWGTSHVVSPEMFFTTVLEPGETVKWNRLYTFYNL